MKKSFLFLVLSIGLANISSADYLDDWSDKDLCGWMDNPSPPTHIVAEVNIKGLDCDGGVAIKTIKVPIVKSSILVSKLKSWTQILRGKEPIYTTKSGAQIKVQSFDNEKSITLNRFF